MTTHRTAIRVLFFSDQVRIGFMIFLAFLLFSVLGLQLWNTQVIHRADYEDQARRQSVRKIRIPPMRGQIITADGIPIAANRASWDVLFHPSEMRKPMRSLMIRHILTEAARAAACIGRPNPLTEKKISDHLFHSPGIPLTLFKDLSVYELSRLKELVPRIEGMEIACVPVRSYPFGSLATHILGYTRMGDPSREIDRGEYNYYVSDPFGASGIEKICNDDLRGSPGSELVMVNSAGFVCEQLETPVPAANGHNVHLTLDLNAQMIAEKLLKNRIGSIVVLDARTGAVIAMASSPGYSAEDFKSADSFRKLLENKDTPFMNRATAGVYMPGSVIKPLCGLASLENGGSPDDLVNCTGRTRFGYGRGIKCNSRWGHGEMDLRHALKKSCNVYFVENAVRIGIDALSAMYASAGIGSPTGIEIAERHGLLPRNGPKWNTSETAYVGFGQGKLLVTPLQVASYFAAIANGGILMRPYLIDRITETDGTREAVIRDTIPQKRGQLAASKESIDVIREGMFLVVNEAGGSGVRAKIPKTVIYGKTGTADVGDQTSADKSKHVWFAGFAENPVTKRVYSIAAIVEQTKNNDPSILPVEDGGRTAAPLVGSFFDQWFPDAPAEEPEAEEEAAGAEDGTDSPAEEEAAEDAGADGGAAGERTGTERSAADGSGSSTGIVTSSQPSPSVNE